MATPPITYDSISLHDYRLRMEYDPTVSFAAIVTKVKPYLKVHIMIIEATFRLRSDHLYHLYHLYHCRSGCSIFVVGQRVEHSSSASSNTRTLTNEIILCFSMFRWNFALGLVHTRPVQRTRVKRWIACRTVMPCLVSM